MSTRGLRPLYLSAGAIGARRPLMAAVWLGLLVAATASGCHRMPLTAPSGSALTLVASANVVPVNGQATIIAVVLEGAQGAGTGTGAGTVTPGVGTPVADGTHVTFTTTLGTIQPADAETSGGKATVMLVADGRSGTATITAFSGPATNHLDVDVGAAGATHVAVTANPNSLPPTGGSSTISARVEDQQGNGLLGVPVSFSTSKGTLSNTTVISDSQGMATTMLTTTAEATVTASTGGSAAALSGTVTVTLDPQTTLALTPPTTAMVGVPGAFTVTPGTATVITDVSVNFGDGASRDLGPISAATQVAHVYTKPGVYSASATATSNGKQTTVGTDVVVSQMTVSATYSPDTATTPHPGDAVTITVTVPAGAAVSSYEFQFDDGAPPAISAANVFIHHFPNIGTSIVTILVHISGSSNSVQFILPVDIH